MDFGMPMMSVHELIEMISNDDIMFQYQGVMQLRELLTISDEKQLGGFPLEKACKKLIEILGQPVISEFSHEIKFFAMQCLHTLMDIYPTHIPTLISQNLIENLTEAMEAASAFGLEDMNHICIKVIEQITAENPRAIMQHGKTLVLCVNIIEFLDNGLQKRVLKILHNVAFHANSEEQFNNALVPTLPVLCQMLQLNCEDDIEKAERVSIILKRMADSFTRFLSPVEKFDRVGTTFEHLSTIGVVEVMVSGLEDFAAAESAKSKKSSKNSDQQEDLVMQQNISTFAVNKRTYNSATISNFLRILSVACKYSQQIVMQLISGGLLDTLEELLPEQDGEIIVYTQDVLSLLENLFPATEATDGSIALSGSLLQLGTDQTLHNDSINNDPRMEQYKNAVKTIEAEKRTFFLGFEIEIQTRFVSKLLPKIFSVYKMNLQTNIRTRCLDLIDKLLHVVQPALIATSIDPVQFASFIEIIFLSGNGQQVLLSLRMIQRVLETQQHSFSVQFIRQGIFNFVTQLQDAKNATQYDIQEIKPLDPFSGSASNFLPRQFNNEKEMLVQRIKEIQTIIQMSGEELNQEQKDDLEQILQDRMNALISLKAKERMVAEVQAAKIAEEKKLKDNKQETKEEKPEVQKLSDIISKEAQNLSKLYFNNGDYIVKVKQQFPEEIQILQLQKKLSQAFMEESIQQHFDVEKTQKLMTELASLITSAHGITNYEFTESGLLKALQQFLTVPPSQSYKNIYAEEEVKTGDVPTKPTRSQLTKKDSECLILRLKVFAHVMCHQIGSKIPFISLIAQCHSVLSVNEPILFSKDTKDDGQNTVDALKQLSRHCVINLVYDPDRKQIDKDCRKTKEKVNVSNETDPLKLALADNKEMIEDDEEPDMSESPALDRKIKSAMPFEHLSAGIKDEKSLIYYRRHKLFSELTQVPLNIQQRDNIWLLEDFLLKRLKTMDDVKKLVAHTRPAYSSGLFKNNNDQMFKDREELEEIEKYELQEMYARCLEKIDYVISNAQDSTEFNLMMPDVIKELTDLIQDNTKQFNFTEKELELCFKHLARDTEDLIREQELGQGSGEEDQELIDRDASEMAYYIQIKVMDFLKMIEKLREVTFDKIKPTKPADDQLMTEETKDNAKTLQPITKILPTEVPKVENQQQSVNSISEFSDSASQQKPESSKPVEQSLSVSQSSDIEMTDEQNNHSQIFEDKPLDEAMKDDEMVEERMHDFVAMMPGKLTKSKMDEADLFGKNQKLIEQKIQKFKQQHIMQQIAPDKALVIESGQSQDEDYMKLDIEELIRMNQGEDIDIEFYFNGKRLELKTSFYEIIKQAEDPLMNSGSDKKSKPKNQADQIREVLANLNGGGQGFSLPNYHTIHFLIKDKPKQVVKERKDSIADVAYRIQRSKSQVHEDISLNSANMLVQELIENEFQVLPAKVQGDKSKKDKLQERNLENIEHSLKILKVLNFVHKNPSLLTEQGINFLLHKSIVDQQLKKLAYDDMELLSVAGHQIKPITFRHAKIDDNMIKSIQNPYKLVQDGLSDILKNIFQSCPFLFDFETKLLYFKLVSFIGIDINRSLLFLQNYLNQKGLLSKAQEEGNTNSAINFFNRDRDDSNRSKIRKQLFTIDRTKVLEEACRICPQLQKRSLLEIQYHNEVGTGLGPTLEFYTLLAEELVKAENCGLWLKTGTNYLFPKALIVTPSSLEKTRKTCSLFQLIGTFVAKSIVDDRLIDIPVSPLMWDLILGKKMNLFDLRRLNQLYFNTFSQLQTLANRKKEVDAMLGLDYDSRKRLLGSIKTPAGASVEDFDLYFVCPTDPSIELIKDGQEEKVTLDNLQDYIDLSLHFIFHETVNLQIKAFKKGFSQILPIESLRPFNSEEELENLICGQLNDAEWTNYDKLIEVITPDHGFDRNSRVFRDFIRYLTEVKSTDRPQLMKFLSGSKRMHAGGFAALNPRLTVVLKKVEGISDAAPDLHLPSVSTCAKYLKIPGYSSYDVLKTKFNQAIWEGADNFTLS